MCVQIHNDNSTRGLWNPYGCLQVYILSTFTAQLTQPTKPGNAERIKLAHNSHTNISMFTQCTKVILT